MDSLSYILSIFGVAVFAFSGSLTAARKEMDIIGFLVLGAVTGIGGGTLRDLLLNQPVFWIEDTSSLTAALIPSIFSYIVARRPMGGYRQKALVWSDAFGLALFCVTGAQIGLHVGANWLVILIMGILTGTAGGLLRDIIARDVPLILRGEIYVTAAFFGALAFLLAQNITTENWALVIGGFICFVIRGLALVFKLQLPRINKNT